MKLSKRTKNTIIVILLVASTVVLTGLLGFATNGFSETNPENWELYSINKDNYFKVDDYTVKTINSGNGYNITVTDNGQIKISGKNETESAVEIEVQQIKLPAGTYTFTSGANGTSLQGYNMCLKDSSTGVYYADFGENSTFTLASETELTAYINIGAEKTCNVTFSPVIIEGEEKGSFFTVGS